MLMQPDICAIKPLVALALAEDIGAGDVTSLGLISESTQAEINFVAREELVVCGGFIPGEVYSQLNQAAVVKAHADEGKQVTSGTLLVSARGPAHILLAGERVALNFMQRLSGVATLTRAFVEAVKGTQAVILDTRKTMPGLRLLDKYAVRAGGGQNHRMRLDDMVLIKDNHLALQENDVEALVRLARTKIGKGKLPVVVECDTLAQVEAALKADPDRILLDNMPLDDMRRAVALAQGRTPLEASGGVTLGRVRAIAETGVQFISVGALTHSAPAVDIGGDIVLKNLS